jgi:peptidoglycan hydrolase CwlO-like protein
LQSLRERIGTLEAELEKLGKQVRDLQAESADKEAHIVQIEKQRERDGEDLQGLNIAKDPEQTGSRVGQCIISYLSLVLNGLNHHR